MQKIIIYFFFITLVSCTQKVQTVSQMQFQGNTMGTYYQIKIFGNIPASDRAKLQMLTDAKLHHVNMLMSTYIKDSQISLFNSFESTQAFNIHQSFKYVLDEAMKVHQLSKGAFDITVMPLVRLWGFGPDGPQKVPSDDKVNEVKQYVGSDKLELFSGENKIAKKHPKLQIDLSAIAKGYGVDVVFQDLKWAHPLKGIIVEIGGEVRASGVKDDESEFKVGIEAPSNKIGEKLQKIIKLRDLAIATSGSYRNYFESNGEKFSHTIDINSGKPIKHGLISVSVIAKDCLTADAWATALMASGPEKAIKLANENNLLAYFIIKREKEVEEISSKKMIEFLAKNEIKR